MDVNDTVKRGLRRKLIAFFTTSLLCFWGTWMSKEITLWVVWLQSINTVIFILSISAEKIFLSLIDKLVGVPKQLNKLVDKVKDTMGKE
jgi:hypothetical protein